VTSSILTNLTMTRWQPLPEKFLSLESQDRLDIYAAFAAESGRTPQILEKDVWVCWALGALFGISAALPMAFKGGTSLSKVFDAISRFSEDIDVTIAYTALDDTFDPYDDNSSKKKIKEFADNLSGLVAEHIRDAIVPGLQAAIYEDLGFDPDCVTIDPNSNLNVLVNFPSALPGNGYLGDRILIEFGCRNSILPSDVYRVAPYLAASDVEVEFPVANPNVLSPMRTFWEKATLIHVECHRPEFKSDSSRISRHWYDIDRLASGEIGTQALSDRALLDDVLRVKKVFFNAAYSNYDACIEGGFRLVPGEDGIKALQVDYEAMLSAGMIDGPASDFGEVIQRLRVLENSINYG
jgi:hypothetical protein